METLVFLVFELCAHDQFIKWVDNSKTKRVIVFILAHDEQFGWVHLGSFMKLSCMVQSYCIFH